MNKPTVSIILPTYKDATFLQSAIQSVQAQQFEHWELLIVNDGLTEGVRKNINYITANDARIHIIDNDQNLGIQRSLNRGIVAAKGEYIARIDDDDIWTDSKKIIKQIAFFEAHPDHVLVGTNASIVDEVGQELVSYQLPMTDAVIRLRMLSKNCFLHPTVMIRKDALKKVGGYSEDITVRHIEDYALWLALGTIGKVANIPDCTTQLMVHQGSLTYENRITQAQCMQKLAKRYGRQYPNRVLGQAILLLRIIGFFILKVLPLPKALLYRIQKIYKQI